MSLSEQRFTHIFSENERVRGDERQKGKIEYRVVWFQWRQWRSNSKYIPNLRNIEIYLRNYGGTYSFKHTTNVVIRIVLHLYRQPENIQWKIDDVNAHEETSNEIRRKKSFSCDMLLWDRNKIVASLELSLISFLLCVKMYIGEQKENFLSVELNKRQHFVSQKYHEENHFV